MTKFHSLLAATAMALLVSGPALAQNAAPAAGGSLIANSRTAVMDPNVVLRDSTAVKGVREQMEAKQKAYSSEYGKKEDALQKEGQELSKLRSTLSKEAFEAKARAFQEKMTAAQKEVASKKVSIERANDVAIGKIQKAIGEIVSEMAKEKGFIVAMLATQVVYADPALDISQEVVTRLNQRLPKVDVTFESAAPAAPAKKK